MIKLFLEKWILELFQDKTYAEFQTIQRSPEGYRVTYILPLRIELPQNTVLKNNFLAYSLTFEYKRDLIRNRVIRVAYPISGYILTSLFSDTLQRALKGFLKIPYSGSVDGLNKLFDKKGERAYGFSKAQIEKLEKNCKALNYVTMGPDEMSECEEEFMPVLRNVCGSYSSFLNNIKEN